MKSADTKAILLGLVSSAIFLAIIQPAMAVGWKFLNWIGPKVSDELVNAMYGNAALGLREVHSFMGFAMVACLFVASAIILTLRQFFEAREIDRDEAIEREIGDFSEEQLRSQASKWLGRMRRLTALNMVFVGVGAIGVFFMVSMHYADLQMNASFNQRLNVLAPYVGEMKIKVLRSRWAQM